MLQVQDLREIIIKYVGVCKKFICTNGLVQNVMKNIDIWLHLILNIHPIIPILKGPKTNETNVLKTLNIILY